MLHLIDALRTYIQLKLFDFNSILQRIPTEECIYTRNSFYNYDFVTSDTIIPFALRMHCELTPSPTETLIGMSLPSIWITEGRRLVIKRGGKFFYLPLWKIKKSLSVGDIKALRAALSGDTSRIHSTLISEAAEFTKRIKK